MNCLMSLMSLKNRYFGLRHGLSRANQEGIVVSDPRVGCQDYGLVPGAESAIESSVASCTDLDCATIIFHSIFLRACQSALVARRVSGSNFIFDEARLCERFFGTLEGGSSNMYGMVWRLDGLDSGHNAFGVESVDSVLTRVTSVIVDIEKAHSGEKFLLVSHGDPLQILETGFRKISSTKHRLFKNFEVGEVREFHLA